MGLTIALDRRNLTDYSASRSLRTVILNAKENFVAKAKSLFAPAFAPIAA